MDAISQYFARGASRVACEGRRATAATPVTPHPDDSVPSQGFRVRYREDEVIIDHADDAGLAAGLEVVEELNDDFSFDSALEVRDAPVLATRAFLLDVSGDRIPNWDGIVRTIEMLERLRFNQLELRVGHAFTFRDQDVVWEDASPLTPAQLRRIEALCDGHGIRLVTAMEPLTHWERWLSHPEYSARAELPEGRDTVDGRHVPPSELAATPSNAHFVAGLIDQLTAALSARCINIGGHSTRELGLGVSRAAVERNGLPHVYFDFLEHATQALSAGDVVAEMWADVLALDPELIGRIQANVTPIVRCSELPVTSTNEGGGESRTGGFAAAGRMLEGSGRTFWVAPGSGSWNTFCGRTRQAVANVADAMEWGVPAGASGMLLTAWAGRGHWAPSILNLPALIEAGVRAWRGTGTGEDLPALMASFVPEDVAACILRLGDIPALVPIPIRNTDLTWEALRTGGHLPKEWKIGVDEVRLVREVVRDAERMLHRAHGGAGAIPRGQASLCVDMCLFGLTLVDVAQGRSSASRVDLQGRWAELVTRQRRVWLVGSREGGLEHSLSLLDPVGE